MNYEFKYRLLGLAATIACPNPHITIQTKNLADGGVVDNSLIVRRRLIGGSGKPRANWYHCPGDQCLATDPDT
jgi:hypothetical protein